MNNELNPEAPSEPKPKRRIGVFGMVAIVFAVFALLLVTLIYIAVSSIDVTAFTPGAKDSLDEKVVLTGAREKIAVIPVSGVIRGDGSYVHGTEMVSDLTRKLRRAGSDKNVLGVILQMNSPGGGLTASDIIHNEVVSLKQKGKKVVVWVGDLAASGGYYIAAPADSIVASPTSMIGSIGVIMHRFSFKETLKMLGIKSDPIMSTDSKDIGSPFRDMTAEERKYFEQMLKYYHQRFISVVAKGRDMTEEKVAAIANGKIYTVDQSLTYGLIDKIGYFDDALAIMKQLSSVQNPTVVVYRRRGGAASAGPAWN